MAVKITKIQAITESEKGTIKEQDCRRQMMMVDIEFKFFKVVINGKAVKQKGSKSENCKKRSK